MQRLFNVDKWLHVEDGKAITFEKANSRRVRLDVNAPAPANLYYADGDGRITFLARVLGRDVIEFASYGEFSITVDGSDVWVHTIDGEDISFAIPDAVVFTRIVERRQRNPELEMMNYMMNANFQRLLEGQRDELEVLWDRREAAIRAEAEKRAPAGAGSADTTQPAPAGAASGAGVTDETA